MARLDLATQFSLILQVLNGMERGDRISISELAAGIGYDARRLKDDLTRAQFTGVPPFGGGDTVDIIVEEDGGEWYVEVMADLPAINAPLRLSDEQTSAVVLALMMSGYEISSDLVNRLLESSSSGWNTTLFDRILAVTAAAHDPQVYQTVGHALQQRVQVEIEHRSISGEVTQRTVEPVSIFLERTFWYLKAWCTKSEDLRTFRMDRIVSARIREDLPVTHTREWLSDALGKASVEQESFDAAAVRTAHLRFDDPSLFVRDEWHLAESVRKRTDGKLDVRLPLVRNEWVANRVLGFGGAVEVIDPADLRETVLELAQELRAELGER